jgi:hypothetical protein
MKFLNKLSVTLMVAVLLVASAWILYSATSWDSWVAAVSDIAGLRRIVVLSVAGGMLSLVILVVLTSTPKKHKHRLLSFENEGGAVSISTDAICDYVGKLSSEFPSIVKLVPHVLPVKKAVDLKIGVKIKAGPQIHEVCELLQQRARESVTNGLGISQIRNVEVSVTDIVSEHKPG